MPPPAEQGGSTFPHWRGFLADGIMAGVAASALLSEAAEGGDEASFDLNELSITDLQESIKAGKYTARDLVEKYLARIEEIDRKGPTLRSVIETNPDALALADELDRELKK